MFENKDDTILARWLAGTLTSEEKIEFEQSIEYNEYLQIVNGLERLKKPSFDKEAMRNRIKSQIKQPKKGKVINLKTFLYATSIAASIILIVGVFFNEVTYKTNIGEQLAFTLPNGSQIKLNAQSKLTRKRFFWKNNRKVNLQGEGFFIVEKGNDFLVETRSGVVTVLGTKFNVKSRDNLFELECFEGKVNFEVTATKENIILTKGKAIKLIEETIQKNTTEGSSPSWTKGKSSFNNVPLSEALNELQIQYDIIIENNFVDISKKFTGSFFHDDLDIAVKTILVPMGIEYELTNDKKVLKLLSP